MDRTEERTVAGQQGSNEDFNFWRDVIGDDLVVDGVVYDSNVWQPDGEGGVERRDPQD
ncbi:hypothetical protein ACFVXC_41425 [Streptomyces sp. NPDC058257]|jgi:hypothetical protein|uniref:hypothetical protein n=1 Tax=Streptomyces sp. NPDC058257 TaxID=3346409 RepID=UPI0036E05C9C